MTTKDFDIAREIVSSLEALQTAAPFLRNPCEISLTHTEHIETERTYETEIRVSPEQIEHQRLARNAWQDDIGIRVKLFGKSDDHLSVELLEQWLEFVDEITAHLKTIVTTGGKASNITSGSNQRFSRYNRQALKEYSMYSTTLLVRFLLI